MPLLLLFQIIRKKRTWVSCLGGRFARATHPTHNLKAPIAFSSLQCRACHPSSLADLPEAGARQPPLATRVGRRADVERDGYAG